MYVTPSSPPQVLETLSPVKALRQAKTLSFSTQHWFMEEYVRTVVPLSIDLWKNMLEQ